MSLIVARKYKDNFIIIGDTKITNPSIEKNNPIDGLIKSVIVNPQLCISVAGMPGFGNEALKEIGTGKPKEKVIEILESYHSKSDAGTQFLICFGNPDFELVSIKDGTTENLQNGWIGSHPAFEKFQYYFHTPKEVEKIFKELTTFKIQRLPDEFDEEGRNIYSLMLGGMNGVIEDSEINEVGGFSIPIIYEKNRFEYMGYGHVYRKPIDFDAEFPDGKGGTINFGGAEDGSYTINISNSTKAKIAIHFYQGDLGITYKRDDLGLLYPKLHPKMDEIDFSDKIKEEDDIALSFHIQHGLGNFAKKGIEKLKEHKFNDAINYFNRGIRIASRTWEEPQNGKNEYENLSDFIKEKGEAKIRMEDANNLKLAFFHRGVCFKKLSNFEKAYLDFKQSCSIDGDYLPALIEKGIAEFQLNKPNEAINTMTECLNKNPNEVCYHNRGYFYLRTGSIDSAESDFKMALSINPQYQNSIIGLNEIERIKNKNGS
jgi:tetratricopeptide (TPR) repeat protein